jgi:hypothetical protein
MLHLPKIFTAVVGRPAPSAARSPRDPRRAPRGRRVTPTAMPTPPNAIPWSDLLAAPFTAKSKEVARHPPWVARHPPFGERLPDTHRMARGILTGANHSEVWWGVGVWNPLEKSSPRLVLFIREPRQRFLQALHEPAQVLQPLARIRNPLGVREPPLNPVLGHRYRLARLVSRYTRKSRRRNALSTFRKFAGG